MREKIIEIASQVLDTAVGADASQSNTEAWDSLHHLDLIVGLEAAFDVSFAPEEIGAMQSIAAIEQHLQTKL
jgi:acyl carrier protein